MKRIVAILLCLALGVGCIAGCQNTTPTAAPTTKPTTAPTQAPTNKTEAPTETEEPTDAKPELGILPLTTEKKTIRVGIPTNMLVEDYDTNAYTVWLEEQTGVDIEFVYFSSNSTERNTQLNLMVASATEKLPDILLGMDLAASLRNELGEDGYLLDLTDYFENYSYWYWELYDLLDPLAQQTIFAQARDPQNGALYVMPGCSDTAANDSVQCQPAINKKWLEALNMEVPTTVEELYDVLVAFRDRDPNGNGINDEIPMIGSNSVGYCDVVEFIINAWVYLNDKYFYNVTDGKIWLPHMTDEYRQALIYLNKLYAEGLLSPMFYTIKKSAELKVLTTPKEGPNIVGVTCGHTGSIYEAENDKVDEYTALPPMKAETSLGGYAPQQTFAYTNNVFITCDAEDPLLCFKFIDFLSGYESLAHQRYGEYGVDWVWAPEEKRDTSYQGTYRALDLINKGVWTDQNNQIWHTLTPKNWPCHSGINPISSEDTASWSYRKGLLAKEIWLANRDAGLPDEVCYTLVYNDEEGAINADLSSTITEYINEARAFFVAGTLDPNDDAAWNTYLNTLKDMGVEDLIKAANSAYTRMYGN